MMRLTAGMKALAAAAALLATPALAQDAPVAFTLSTTMQRTCNAQMQVTPLSPSGAPIEQPTVVRSTRGFYARPDARGLVITQWAREPSGEGRLVATISPSGYVLNARLEGSLVDAMQSQSPTPIDVDSLAAGFARDIPERLVMGRRFAVGDPLYDPAMAQLIVDQLMAAFGVPFPVQSEVNVVFLGAQTAAMGRNIYAFGGDIRLWGQGRTPNGLMGVDAIFNFRIEFDQSTGLVLNSDNGGEFGLTLNGQPAMAVQMTDSFTCQIGPQNAR